MVLLHNFCWRLSFSAFLSQRFKTFKPSNRCALFNRSALFFPDSLNCLNCMNCLNDLNNYLRLSLLNNSRNNFSVGSRKPVTRYFLPSSRLAGAATLSLGMSILMESDGSSTFVFMTACQTVCPSRERNQLAKTRAALRLGALLTKASPLLPLVLIS